MRLKKGTKKKIINVLLVLLGSILLAFGTIVFLIPCNLVTGGLSGLSIIFSEILKPVFGEDIKTVDIINGILTWAFFALGALTLGKKFALNTLVYTITEPLFVSLIYRTGVFNVVSNCFITESSDPQYLMKLLLAGVFGGAIIGSGVSLAFKGDGSTGGFDVLQLLISKYLRIKESISSFILDATVIAGGIILSKDILVGLICIISAFSAALFIEIVYVAGDKNYIAEIVSDKIPEIVTYVNEAMGRGSTILDVSGGFSGQPRKMIKVAFDKNQILDFKRFMGEIDPKAFVMIYTSHTIIGEGFQKPHKRTKKYVENGNK